MIRSVRSDPVGGALLRTGLSLALVACAAPPPAPDLPPGHPARPDAEAAAVPAPGDVLARTTTFDLPRPARAAPAPAADARPEHGAAGASPVAGHRCPMHPHVTSAEPGTCPECGMALVPSGGHVHGGDER